MKRVTLLLISLAVIASGGIILAACQLNMLSQFSALPALVTFALTILVAWLTARTRAAFARHDHLRRQFQQQSRLLQAVLRAIPAPIFFKDHRGIYLGCNRAFEAFIGLPREKIIGASVWDVAPRELADTYHRADSELMEQGGQQVYETEVQYADGSRHHVMFHKAVFAAADGSPAGLVGAMLDITDRKQVEQEIEELAYHDNLTGLANRSFFKQRLTEALTQAAISEQQLALLFLDLDRFKYINDTIGHAGGDRLLQLVAERLSCLIPAGGTLARLGGDEFVIMLTDVHNRNELEHFGNTLLKTLEKPFLLAGKQLHVSTSIGIARYPADGKDSSSLLKHADMAMYAAKEQGRNNLCFYRKRMTRQAAQRRDMETRLRQALDQGEFALVYQPQIDDRNGRIRGVEALLRWHHPRRGLVYPAEFIPIAEETGLIRTLGEWVLRESCRQLRTWRHAQLPNLRMAVNISGQQFKQPDFLTVVDRALREADFDPARLELEMELTETVLLHNVETTLRNLRGLKERGISLAIDDFGTGYSSLSYLKDFPIDRIKIDRSFVGEISHGGNAAAIVGTIIAMARSLGLAVIAEGVETAQQVEFLRQRDCFDMQGYYFARPMPAAVLERYLQNIQTGKNRRSPGLITCRAGLS
ncbi:putative bifunctional diguanylate cyclase/phosphodiesterase [Geothermobacter hydrogeniphilus]|uniref:PAS domain S-box-containing protein/diguanylate cyclase (GGDEF) domain-containing protein n=1 Tax=Geothermobacter hydrogeniphilus TaxID=1969733 RepID=A0A1X0Y4Y9_9BACT|nr:EAL domain-containing protein [Geothermobacter hydrogeniphilus]ORJ60261.1 hypothetical protein B5V00_08390 [Geothermobacter hydrogeniphilus]